MPLTIDQTQAQTTTPVDLGAIFPLVGIEEIDVAGDRSVSSQREMSRHQNLRDIAGLFACFAALRQKATRRTNMLYSLVVSRRRRG
jgi:transposase